jgi:hypothetical protein
MRSMIPGLCAVAVLAALGCKENNINVDKADGVIPCASKPPTPGFIDDFECGQTGKLPEWEGRNGGYFTTSDDQTGNTFLDPNDPDFSLDDLRCSYGFDGSTSAGCARGKTPACTPSATCWGGAYDIAITVDGSPYDAQTRGYTGVRFMLRNVKAGKPQVMRFGISDGNTLAGIGRCTECNDFFGTELTATSQWQEVTLHFAELKQLGFGDPQPALATSELMNIEWKFGPGQDIEVGFDDIAFVSD